MAIASASCTHLEGQYCNFSNIKNSWRDSLRQLTSMTKFHLGHRLARATQNTIALEQMGSSWVQWSLKHF